LSTIDRKNLPDLIFRNTYEKVESSISKTPPFYIVCRAWHEFSWR
jgi:hypothetical protein